MWSLLFFFKQKTAYEMRISDWSSDVCSSDLNEINSRTLSEVVSGDRSEVIERQLDNINVGAKNIGIRIVDLRIKKIDLPTDSTVIRDVYRRMSAQRQQVASRLRAEGEEQAQKIRSEADRDRTVILAAAERDAPEQGGERTEGGGVGEGGASQGMQRGGSWKK